jgi:hypothetical protein
MQIFDKYQRRALEDGQKHYEYFVNEVKKAVSGDYSRLMKKHFAFTSMPGLTKTTVIIKLLTESGVQYFEITGKKSMRDFLYQLCFIVESSPKGKPIIIFIDDCEFIFANNDNMNIFKVMIGKQRLASYSNNGAIDGVKKMPEPIKKAVMKNRLKDSEGFSFSTKDVHFIIASNVKFPTEEQASIKQLKSPGPSAEMLVSKAAIGDRMNTHHIDFQTWEEQWGYVANQIINNPYFGDGEFEFTLEERQQMVLFTWNNFDKLKSKSFRCYEGLAQDMLNYPDDYMDKWNSSSHLDVSYHKNKK